MQNYLAGNSEEARESLKQTETAEVLDTFQKML